ncbi:MAG: hypothetical protein JO300_15820, partial [Silvibacterium sp.]|nr:hypothetical protein [Silvibacterium sp.]
MARVFATEVRTRLFRLGAIVLFAGLCGVPALSQQSATQVRPVQQSAAPTPLMPAPPKSPQVDVEGNATFTLAMPNAAKVELRLEGVRDPIPM